jgi:plastocyanin
MKRLTYVASLSVLVVLVFAAIALAQDSSEQSTSDPNSIDPAQSSDTSEEATPAQSTPTVSILSGAFDPAQLSAAPGTTVTFVNADTVPHTVDLDGLFDTPEIPPGYTYPVSFDGTGTVTYHDETNPEIQGSLVFGEVSQVEPTISEEPVSVPPSTTDSSTQTSEDSAPTDSVS